MSEQQLPIDPLSAGIVSEGEHDISKIEQVVAPPADGTQPQMREVKIKFPAAIPEQMIQSAVRLGMMIIGKAEKQVATLAFLHVKPQEDASKPPEWTIGTAEMLALDPSDVSRIVDVMNAINQANGEAMRAAAQGGQVSDMVGTALQATKRKDDAVEKAKTNSKIIIPD